MSEKKLEECSLQEATHAESVTGEVYLISKSENRLRIVVEGYSIFNETWKALGIKPLKEIKPKPIVFEFIPSIEMAKDMWLPADFIVPMEAVGKKFKCVEILEEN